MILMKFITDFVHFVLKSPAVIAASSKADCTYAIQYSLGATEEEPSYVKFVEVRRWR
jgi:hypothetical protein